MKFGLIKIVCLFILLNSVAAASNVTILETCDFDILASPEEHSFAQSYYVGVCGAVFKNAMYHPFREVMDREAKYFAIYQQELEKYEVALSNKELCSDGVYYADENFRDKLYAAVNIHDCYMTEKLMTFLKCMTQKRIQMIKIVKDAAAKIKRTT